MFHPLIQKWFENNIGTPTAVQEKAWPVISRGDNILVTAPTGSGKTLTAFMWGIQQLITGNWPTGATRILYISPLKALNNDIQRNLLIPLAGIQKVFRQDSKACPSLPTIRVLTRSGDTPQKDRRKMLRKPPEILITTPESLNIMLSSQTAPDMFGKLCTVILDEIHAVAQSPRGVHLMTAVERLVPIAGEFQRIALSATVKPLETVAAFVGGYRGRQDSGSHSVEGAAAIAYEPRPVTIIDTPEKKNYELSVRFPPSIGPDNRDDFWEPVAGDMRKIMDSARSTLIFANNRRLCEKLTLRINRQEGRLVAYAHHGALAKALRLDVERRLKAGLLKGIVATSSLEMGIDIGNLDRVVMVQTPDSIASAVQRAGRANHQVGETSHATLYPVYAGDTLAAAVMARAIHQGDIESVAPMEAPLDVLAQVMVSMVCAEPWDVDEMFNVIRSAWSYRNLTRRSFDLVLQMLAGKYAGARIEELKARVFVDAENNTVSALSNARLALYGAGGMIPNRGYYTMRHASTRARIGELDEEFVWEARRGDRFTLGSQKWKIEKITHSDVLVSQAEPHVTATPFWKADPLNRSWHFSSRILEFLESMETFLSKGQDITETLMQRHFMETEAADMLRLYLGQQRTITGAALPHRHHVVVEHVQTGPDDSPGTQCVIHTFWGGRLNRPFAMALEAAWKLRFGGEVEVFPDNNQVVVQLPESDDIVELMNLVTAENVESLIGRVLEFSGVFGARFREGAGRAMLIQRQRLNQRLPLWMTRLKAQKLLEKVKRYNDFPVLLEAWRSCLTEEFNMPILKELLTEIEEGHIAVSYVTTVTHSPMAQSGSWSQVNKYMYAGDSSNSREGSRLDQDLVSSVVQNGEFRMPIPQEVIQDYTGRRQRLIPGYGPDTEVDLLQYISERQVIAGDEWARLTEAGVPGAVMDAVQARLVMDEFQSLSLRGAFPESPDQPARDPGFNLIQWLGYYGPVDLDAVCQTLGLKGDELMELLEPHLESGELISGKLIQGIDSDRICRTDNYEHLLRRMRRSRRCDVPIHPLPALAPCLANYQGFRTAAQSRETFMNRLGQLAAFPAPVDIWEEHIFPDRYHGYRPEWLDGWLRDSDGIWLGVGEEKICFIDNSDRDLLEFEKPVPLSIPDMSKPVPLNKDQMSKPVPLDLSLDDLFKDAGARYDFGSLMERCGWSSWDLMTLLWESAWSGKVTTDTFETVRRGIAAKFKSPQPVPSSDSGRGVPGGGTGFASGRGTGFASRRRSLRRRYQSWRQSLPFPGNWYRLAKPVLPDTPVETEELLRDRARLILDRYGIVFRELLDREQPGFCWRDLFRTFQIMELSGEINAGLFFHGIPGIQFVSHGFLKMLETDFSRDRLGEIDAKKRDRLGENDAKKRDRLDIFSMNALDPASICGLGLDGLPQGLPDRRRSNRLVFDGSTPILFIENRGQKLEFRVQPDDDRLPDILEHLARPMFRAVNPVTRIIVKTINGVPADNSEFIAALKNRFDVDASGGKLTLYRKY